MRRQSRGCERGVLLCPRKQVKELGDPGQPSQPSEVIKPPSAAPQRLEPFGGSIPRLTLLAVPLATTIALVLHWLAAKKEPPEETQLYTWFLCGLLLLAL